MYYDKFIDKIIAHDNYLFRILSSYYIKKIFEYTKKDEQNKFIKAHIPRLKKLLQDPTANVIWAISETVEFICKSARDINYIKELLSLLKNDVDDQNKASDVENLILAQIKNIEMCYLDD